ncbi:probable G-protein coupled receptor 139 [Chiloscyllium plagiosum]|uniref:probable G-protein coupled receptor 139 n=1 Tax=Chiloscyllium plagiosum TaxID=36176 RepID=UPI001CB86C15|nr:probable G-protein coupled receptor 139 [Chiloscyllium plagiosum]
MTYYLMSMAVTDLLVMITAVILNRIAGTYFPFSFLSITPIVTINLVLLYGIRDSAVWVTVAFTFDRFVAICCQKLKVKYCTAKMASLIIGTVCAVNCVKNVPLYFTCEPYITINNMLYYCKSKSTFYSSPEWIAFNCINVIITPCLPFIFILLPNVLTVRHIIVDGRARKRLLSPSDAKNEKDPEMEKRRRSIILLFSVSGSFILLYSIEVRNFFYVRITGLIYLDRSGFIQANFILEESGFMLQLLCSCINPFIYAGTQSKFRDELKDVVKYPVTLIDKLFKGLKM